MDRADRDRPAHLADGGHLGSGASAVHHREGATMVYLTRTCRFCAGHRLFRPELSDAQNEQLYGSACSRVHGCGHDYQLEVTVGGQVDPVTGILIHPDDLDGILYEQVIEPVDMEFLTLHHPFCRGRVPTIESLAVCVWDAVAEGLRASKPPAYLHRVRLKESDRLAADCARKGSRRMHFLTRSYEFAAAHRLHSPYLTDEENQEVFGKCNNPYGHGHNYRLEVTVRGKIDDRTGMLVDLRELDRIVQEEVIRRYDHRHLNHEVEEFRELNPTAENLVRVVWRRLRHRIKGPRLYKVSLRETEQNVVSYYGEEE